MRGVLGDIRARMESRQRMHERMSADRTRVRAVMVADMMPSPAALLYRYEKFGHLPDGHIRIDDGRCLDSFGRPHVEERAAAGGHWPPPDFEIAVSFHESGHATAALVLNLPLAGASIDEIDGHHGRTWSADEDVGHPAPPRESVAAICSAIAPLMPPPFADRGVVAGELLRAHHQVVSHLSGQVAEDLFIGRRLEHTEHDLDDARAIARLVCRSEDAIDAYIDYCAVEARALLREHAEVVQAIADGLLAHRMLTRRDIDAIVAGLGYARGGPGPAPSSEQPRADPPHG